jgi:hypothetical protein
MYPPPHTYTQVGDKVLEVDDMPTAGGQDVLSILKYVNILR